MKQDATHNPARWMSSERRLRWNAVVGWAARAADLNWPLILLVLAGIALRLWMIGVSPLDPRFSSADDGDYYRRALRLAVSGQYVDDAWLIRPPLHVFFFAFWLRLALILGQPQFGVLLIQLAQTALGALTIGLGFGIARRLFADRRAGLLFAGFLALWYPFVEHPTGTFSEPLYIFLFLLHLWLLLRFDAEERRRDLALSGLALGAAALTRSPALYSLAFVVLWLVVRWRTKNKEQRTKNAPSSSLFSILGSVFLVVACCVAVVGPWTARNYLVYQHFIPVDTLGQINLWLDLDLVSRRNLHIAELSRLPQADRQAYAMARAREILEVDPLRPFRQMWPTFRHIWKAQYVEDFFVKQSFFTRPLRASAPLGLAGDVIWLAYTLGGLVGLAAPAREGLHNRLFALAWLGYSLLTVLVFHVEPRYLIGIWTLLGLYGAWTLALGGQRTKNKEQKVTQHASRITLGGQRTKNKEQKVTQHASRITLGGQRTKNKEQKVMQHATRNTQHATRNTQHVSRFTFHVSRFTLPIQAALALAFLILFITYRDYPAFIGRGIARERAIVAGERAYAAGDYAAAERAFRAALAAQPDFVDGQVNLALALAAQGRRDEAAALLAGGGSRRAELVAGALARDAGDAAVARETLARIEATAGEDIQRWAITWLRPHPTARLTLGDGLDLGYIEGFSGAEGAPPASFRWLQGDGRIVLPLSEPLRPGATLVLRMTGGRPGVTRLQVRVGDQWVGEVPVQGGQWRAYRLPVPLELEGQRAITVELRAPTFVPALLDRSSDDTRVLSLMVSEVRVE